MNAKNAIEAFRAAADALENGDSNSALDYAVVAVAEVTGERLPGRALLYLTADGAECVRLGTVELPTVRS